MSNSLYKQVLENLYEGVYFVDADRNITFWNKGAERITGYPANEILGKACYDNILKHVDDQGCQLCINGCPLHKTITDGIMREAPVYLHHKEGHRVPVSIRTIPLYEGDMVIGAAELFTDQREQFHHQKNLKELKTLAFHDQLTELPNRRFLEQVLEAKWMEFERMGRKFGIAFMDLDHFKEVNDTHGHLMGDEVLKMVAKTTRGALRREDMVGRWGGEEFMIILSDADEEMIRVVSEKIRMLIEHSALKKEGKTLSVTVSVGAAIARFDDTLESLIKRADEKMYKSKNQGRNQVIL